MKYIAYAIVPFSVGILMPLVYLLIGKHNVRKESKMNSDDYIISSSMVFCSISVFTELIFAAILITLNIDESMDVLQNAISIPFLLFFAFGCYVLIREKIVVKKNKIEHTPFFGKKRIYSFNDIKKVIEIITSRGLIIYQIYSDKKMFIISNMNIGTKFLINRIKTSGITIETKTR